MSTSVSLVTGACGAYGPPLVSLLLKQGHRVIAMDHPEACVRDDLVRGCFPETLRKLGVEPLAADLLNDPLPAILKGVQYVFHAAEWVQGNTPWDFLEEFNVKGTRLLCEALRQESQLKRLVVWSAPFYKIQAPRELPYTEESPVGSSDLYLKSKLFQERIAFQYHRSYELPVTAIRPAWVYGPHVTWGLGECLNELAARRIFWLPSNFTMRFSPVHVADVCRAALHLVQVPEADGQAYHIAAEPSVDYPSLMREVARSQGKRILPLPPLPRSWMRFFSKTPLLQSFTEDRVYSSRKLLETGFQFQERFSFGAAGGT